MASSVQKLWAKHVVAARAQTLEDVAAAHAATVTLLVGDPPDETIIHRLERNAQREGFATATASLAAHGLHELDVLVGELAKSFRGSGGSDKRHGLIAALGAFARAHRGEAEAAFLEAADQEALSGELRALAADALDVIEGRKEPKRLHRWLGGKDVAAVYEEEEHELRQLGARTAKRGLIQLTRLARVLGYRGMRIVLRDADAIIGLSKGRREVSYSVLRELIDNADSARGMVATELVLVGTSGLIDRVGGIQSHPALTSRLFDDIELIEPPRPHQNVVFLTAPPDLREDELGPVPEVIPVEGRQTGKLRALLRIAQGLPPMDALDSLTVGSEEVDLRVDKLFEHAAHSGSVFATLCGDYGSGKTHQLLHLEARALAEHRPVLRLSIERLDEDLGNPQRHLRRLLESSTLPVRRNAGPLDRLDAWLASRKSRRELHELLLAIAEEDSEAAKAARRCLRESTETDLDDWHVHETLGSLDLESKPSSPTYRKDAYARLLLWIELFEQMDGCDGPVLILDEAENLYRAGISRSERRTALRSLAFYCGGSLPRACVVLAVTPDTLGMLQTESEALLDDLEHQRTLLPSEDVDMLRRRLKARPMKVTRLRKDALEELGAKAYNLGRKVRGRSKSNDWREAVQEIVGSARTPREVLRGVAAHVEAESWTTV